MQICKPFSRRLLNPEPAYVLLLILLLGFGLRLCCLGDQNIWWDEGYAVWAARQSLPETTLTTAFDVHPPLYLWLLNGWLRLNGESEFAVRYLSLIGGMLTVALAYVVARRLIGQQAALLAALLLSAARFHIWWSQEARMYVWAAFFALLSVYWFTRLRQGGTRSWWAYVLSSAAALYTLYLAALVLLLENLFVVLTVWRKSRRHFLYAWIISQLSVILIYVPWLYMAVSRIRSDTAKTPFTFFQVWQLYGAVLTTGISTDLDRYTWLLAVFGIVALCGLLMLVLDRSQPKRHGFAGWEAGLLLALPLILPPLVVYGLSIPRGFFYSPKPEARYLLLFAPLFYILIAGTVSGFWAKGRWGRAVSATVLVFVLGTFASVLPAHYAGRYLRDEYQTAMQTLAAYAQPTDAMLVVSGDRYPLFLYYYNRQFPQGDGPAVYLMPRSNTTFTAENVDAELRPLHAQHERLWLASFERSLQDPDNVVETWLNSNRKAVLSVSQKYNFLRLYMPDGAAPPVNSQANPQYEVRQPLGQALLLGYDLPTSEFRPGDVIQSALYVQTQEAWTQEAWTQEAQMLTVHLVNQAGQPIAQQSLFMLPSEDDSQLVRALASFAVYEYTEPGVYSFQVCLGGRCADFPVGRVTHSHKLPTGQPAVSNPVDVGDGVVQFLGYTADPPQEASAGHKLTVDLYWQAHQPLAKDYTVFVHLLGPYNPATGGPVWAQDDGYPLKGGHPTTRWLPGQVVVDRHILDIPADTPSGNYHIEVGLYDLATGERLSAPDDPANRILLNELRVKAVD